MSKIYLNKNSNYKLNLIEENIINPLNWIGNDNEVIDAIKFLEKESKKLIKKAIKEFQKNYKKAYEILKKNKLKPIYLINNKEDIDKLIFILKEKNLAVLAQDIEQDKKEFLSSLATWFFPFNEINNLKDKSVLILINVPKVSWFKHFIKPVFLGNRLDLPSWIELERQIIIYHETLEAYYFSKKEFKNGQFYFKKGGNYIQIGNHYNILVIAHEAIVLNKFKNNKVLNRLRQLRQNFEWKIIKKLSNIDLNTVTKIDKELERKLLNIKAVKLDNKSALLLSLDKNNLSIQKNSKKLNKNNSIGNLKNLTLKEKNLKNLNQWIKDLKTPKNI
jgi:hypothetical protein